MEYESQMPGASYKEIVPFVNPAGSIVYIGIDEQSYLSGMDTVDEIYTKLTNEIRDAFKPDAAMSKYRRVGDTEMTFLQRYIKCNGFFPLCLT